MDELFQNLRFAFRSLWRTPVSTLAAVATLALGIGATTAVFSTVNATLLRPLPFPQPDDLYLLRTTFLDGRATTGLVASSELARLKDPRLSVSFAAGTVGSNGLRNDVTLIREDGTPAPVISYNVTEGFFELFGLPMTLGAGLLPEHHAPGSPPAVVMSHRVWREVFAGDAEVIGRALRFAEVPLPLTVAGVASPQFDIPRGTDFWLSAPLSPDGIVHAMDGYLRVQAGTDPARLRSELDNVMAGLARDYPAVNDGRAYVATPLVEAMVGDLGPTLVLVFSASVLLLLLACANVSTLLLARGATRAREIALRVAIGANTGRVVRQLLTESVVLTAVGVAAGLLFAWVGIRVLLRVGAADLPRLDTVPFDARVLLFAFVVLVVTALTVGFVPGMRLAATNVRTLMNDGGRTAAGGRDTHGLLQAMTIAEIALAITLVAGAGWLVRSFDNLQRSDPGFESAGRVMFDLRLPFALFIQPDMTPEQQRQAFAGIGQRKSELLTRLRGLSGVVSVGTASTFPLAVDMDGTPFVEVPGVLSDPERPPIARQRTVSPDFFDTMGIDIVSGRGFTDQDAQPEAAPVTIVNREFVRRYMGGQDPLASQIVFGYPVVDAATQRPVVGVVDDVQYTSLDGEVQPAYYVPQGDAMVLGRQAVVVQTALADPGGLIAGIRAEVQRVHPQIVIDVRLVPALVASTLSRQRLGMMLMIVFGGIALVLAAVGIYGLIAYVSAQRTGEVATRMALGATQADIFWMMLKHGSALAAVGSALGVGAAYATGRLASSWLYEVRASDPLVLLCGLAVVLAIAIVATVTSARRATRVDPAVVLQAQ
jgi:putative ABC transport system permease protein